MAQYIVWMDLEKAHIFNLDPAGVIKSQFKKEATNHHGRNQMNHHGDSVQKNYYRDLAAKLGDAGELLLLGPGLAKTHFVTHLKGHVPALAKHVIGVENSDHPTDNQVLAAGRKFFKTYNLFNHPIKQGAED